MTYKSFADQLEAETAHAAQTMEYTPASEWSERGEADPHAGHYDCERHQLTMGRFTDDELANGAFMNYDVRPAIQDIIAGKAFSPIAWMTAVKDRIRWLSRQTLKLEAENDELKKQVENLKGRLACKNLQGVTLQDKPDFHDMFD